MIQMTRRGMLAATAAALAACETTPPRTGSATEIDRRVASAVDYMYDTYPETLTLADKSVAMLVMPLIGEAGLFVGGSYGEGALLIDEATVGYYAAAQGSVGFQIGAQTYASVLFFLTPEALERFRTSPGWAAGAAAEFTGGTQGAGISASTATDESVVAFLFARQGLLAGATIEGTKYTPIRP